MAVLLGVCLRKFERYVRAKWSRKKTKEIEKKKHNNVFTRFFLHAMS